MHEYFSLFGLPERFAIDPLKLDAAYRQVQAKVHPDRFAHRPEAERRVAALESRREELRRTIQTLTTEETQAQCQTFKVCCSVRFHRRPSQSQTCSTTNPN